MIGRGENISAHLLALGIMIKTMTANQKMAELFQRDKSTISRHIRNVFESGKLRQDSAVAFLQQLPQTIQTIM